jgi:hypothetical protein
MNLVYDGYNFSKIQEALGERPGGYRVDPDYLRKSWADRPYFWDKDKKKWRMIHIGDLFYIDDEGIPRKTGT